jgi:MYXO-CTERM domain-containing protein
LTPEEAAAGAPPEPFEPVRSCPIEGEEEDSGCTVQRLGTERGIGALFLALGLGAFFVARRRR